MESDTSSESGNALIKQLASCNNGARGRALRVLLKTWLPNQLSLSDEDMKKLWKGLFYCMWHSDKAQAQAQLIDRLTTSLVPNLHLPFAIHYFATFLVTMRREWSGIDALRLDKFYLLIRRFVASVFSLLSIKNWDLELVKKLMGVLEDGTFYAEDKFPGKGVNYHVATVFLDELRPFMPVRKEVAEVLLSGFVRVMGRVNDKVLLGKIKGSVFDVLIGAGRRLLEGRKSGEEVGSGDNEDARVFGWVALTLGFSGRFHEMGESAECCQGNRKVLFGLDEEFLKLEKELAAFGIEVSIPEAVQGDGDDEEVPTLIPIAGGDMEVDTSRPGGVPNGSAGKKSKMGEKKNGGADAKAEKKKKKKKEKKENGVLDSDPENSHTDRDNLNVAANGQNPDSEQVADGDEVKADDYVISNLQMKFEKIAAVAGLDHDVPSACDLPTATTNGTVSKKRKRTKKSGEEVAEEGTKGKSGEKSAKKVKFSMKNNLVWKPQCPLPPQDLRLPPSATPRGSALKQGVPPGPIREMLPPTKKVKRVVKKTRKVVKRVKKLKSRSPQ